MENEVMYVEHPKGYVKLENQVIDGKEVVLVSIVDKNKKDYVNNKIMLIEDDNTISLFRFVNPTLGIALDAEGYVEAM